MLVYVFMYWQQCWRWLKTCVFTAIFQQKTFDVNSPQLLKEHVCMRVSSFVSMRVCVCMRTLYWCPNVIMFFTDPVTPFNYTTVIQWKNTFTWVQLLNTAQHLQHNELLALPPQGHAVSGSFSFFKTIGYTLYSIMKTGELPATQPARPQSIV